MAVQKTDVLIIGGGLVGLSTAMHLQEIRPNLTITVIEKDAKVASQQSGHNSGVLHAGIYYEPGSLKARFCVEGHSALIEYCVTHGIPVVHCGKVIVANTDEEIERLDLLHQRGTENGVPDLRVVDSDELREIEPHVAGVRALHAPHSAIVDYAKVAASYAATFEERGGLLWLSTAFLSAKQSGGFCQAETTAGTVRAKLIVNCAGLHSDRVAKSMGAKPGLRIIPFRGEYFELRKESRHLVKGLIYPVPNPKLPFLGVHFTPRVDGSVEAGPNAILAMHRQGYRWRNVSLRDVGSTLTYGGFWLLAARYWKPGMSEINRSLRKRAFVASLQTLVPEITADDLVAGGSGVRAMAVDRRGRMVDDFQVDESPGAIHVLNAPSPAATSSLMIGRYIANKADTRLAAA